MTSERSSENLSNTEKSYSKELESARALFLSCTEGQKEVRELERKHQCQISIILPGHQVLVRAESPEGHRVFLCEGNMAATDCNVLLLPFSENQRDWTAAHSLVLDRGFLSTKTHLYAKLVGSPPKQRTLTLQCPRPEVRETVILVHVPDLSRGHSLMADEMTEALTEALEISEANGDVIAVPVAMSTRRSLSENLKCILHVIQEQLWMKERSTTVVLYLEKLPTSEKAKLVQTLEKMINQDWNISEDSVAVYQDNYSSSPRLVAVGLMADVETACSKLQSMDVPSVFQDRLSFLDTANKAEHAGGGLNIPADRAKWCRVEKYPSPECAVSVEVKREDDTDRTQDTRTVSVDGLTKDDRELCELYFLNSKRSGGGTHTSLVWDHVAQHWLVTFEQREVAARVASKQHVVNGQPIEVKLYVAPASVSSKLMFHNVPETASLECLTMYLQKIVGQKVTDLIYGDEDGEVLAVFDRQTDFLQIKEMCRQKKLEGQELWVSRVPVSNCILLENLSEATSEDTVMYYFSNKRSGGGPVEKVDFKKEQRKCLVFFKSHEVIENILRKPHTLDGSTLQVRQYFECLGPSGGRRNPKTFTLPKTLDFTDVDKYKTFFIQQSTPLQQRLTQQLTALHAKPMFSHNKLSVECTLTSSVEDVRVLARTWTSDVQAAVNSILNMIVVLRQEVTQEMWNETKHFVASIKPASKESAVVITWAEEKVFIVVGMKSMADDLMKQVKHIVIQKEEETKRKQQELTETVRNHSENLKEISLPRKWQPMNEDEVQLIDLHPGSVEYKHVMHFLGGQPVGQIQRVQNPVLYKQYKMKEHELKTHNPPNTENEKKLWYSTDIHNINKIIANGFQHQYCRDEGTDYGQGVCFKTSLKTFKDPQWSPHAILALVLVGEFTQGVPSMAKPPRKPNSLRLYDSLSGPDMFIIYQDDQAYPEYLVTFMTS